jgi:hypothetical protein
MGYIIVLLGILSIAYGVRLAIGALSLSTLFGAAAALQLPWLGGASIQPGHLMVLFFVASALLRPVQTQAALASIAYPGPGFWFAAYVLFSVASAFFLPRIFAGATLVYSSARDVSGTMSTVASPLSPGTSNVTQAIYLLSDLACVAVVAGLARLGYASMIARSLIVTAMACLFFALLDIATFLTGQSQLLDFIRNANYTMHTAETIVGFKRIVGSFPEASAYAGAALVLFSFTFLLWLERFTSRLAGLAAGSIGITILMCTSTTAYIAGLFVLCILVLFSMKRLLGGRAGVPHTSFLIVTLFIVPCVIVTIMQMPDVSNSITELVDATFTDKLESQSGEERTSWNTLALISFVETSTFGAGLGTVRASSFIAALLSNVGLCGTLLFAVFLYSLLTAARRHPSGNRQDRAIGIAAVFASIAQIAVAMISGSSTDLGLLFSITAGLAAGCLAAPHAVPRYARGWPASARPREASPMLVVR